ncbi:hypothetical protein [Parapedobacter sp.]
MSAANGFILVNPPPNGMAAAFECGAVRRSQSLTARGKMSIFR